MTITFHYMGQLRQCAGVEREERQCTDSASLNDALRNLAQSHNDDFINILFDDAGAMRSSVMLLLNETPVAKDDSPALRDGDEITLLSAISGG